MKTEKRRVGDIGENIACMFLGKHGFEIIDRNYLRKWGEIDIVAKKGSVWHFVEVKSASGSVTRETGYRPEENVHPQKLKRLYRAISTYMLEKRIDADWVLDIVTVRVDEEKRVGRCELLENIIV
jgi:putative endonuclease